MTMQWDLIDISWLFYAAAVIVVPFVAYGIYQTCTSAKKKKLKSQTVVQKDKSEGWTPTGRIDFAGAATENFVLRVEETLIVEGISGTEYRDIHWRKATLEEAKAVVVAYHAQRNLAMRASYIVSSANKYGLRQSDPENAQQETAKTVTLHPATPAENPARASSVALMRSAGGIQP